MSRKSTMEVVGNLSRVYTSADRKKRRRILDESCDTTGYERKYALKLLTGNRKFKERKGRARRLRFRRQKLERSRLQSRPIKILRPTCRLSFT